MTQAEVTVPWRERASCTVEKLGQRRGRGCGGTQCGGALDAAAHVWDTGHQVLLGTGWHALTGAVMEMQWWSLTELSYLNPDAAGESADGVHPT